jgi:hypothetical protein
MKVKRLFEEKELCQHCKKNIKVKGHRLCKNCLDAVKNAEKINKTKNSLSESEENQSKEYKEAFQKYVNERKKLKIKIDYEKDEKRKRDLQRQFADLKDEFYKKWH